MIQIKLIIFDLDGVLINKDIHYQAFSKAIHDIAGISLSYEEHEQKYDGRPTTYKIKLLEQEKGLDHKLSDKIWVLKQRITLQLLEQLKPDPYITELLKNLHNDGYNLALASNAITQTATIALDSMEIYEYFNPIITNENIKCPKPHPSCYWRCMEYWNVFPQETIIIEDSPVGIEGAQNSCAYVYECITPDYLSYDKITKYIKRL